MINAIDSVISKLERIEVRGMGAILMGESLKELLAIKANLEKPEEKEDADD